ncbi:MAG: hypothetical protein IJM30_07575 [Thermoguttaceae bacterium]|nr:hypothetical protein [Thermoguttaceae bacterium]
MKTIILSAFLGLIVVFSSASSARGDEPYFVYDLSPLQNVDRANPTDVRRVWDETLLVSALQGLANRDSARLYVLFVRGFGKETDKFWLELFSQNWLKSRERRDVESLDAALDLFSDSYNGVVLYDENVPSTVNVALTIAGVERLLPVRYDPTEGSLYDRIVANGRKLPVKSRLINKDGSPMFVGSGKIPGTKLQSTGSAKVDPYYWLIEKYMKTGKVDPTDGNYYIDADWIKRPIGATQNHCLTNRDFGVANKGFFFDLSPWEDETPNDDREQPLGADFNAFNAIMRAAYDATRGKKAICVRGFTPWDSKYTDHGNAGCKHPGVATEWRHAEILSNYNAYLDADALGCGAMANASFFRHFPLKDSYPQQKPTVDDLKARGFVDEAGKVADKTFVAIYGGDYDSAAWVYQAMPVFWNDSARGEIPISWAFNPNLADRFAPGFDYFRETKTPNDFFIAGDSGAGYVNPTGFVEPRRFSGLPDNLDVWVEHCKKYFKRWDISGIGFVIDGDARTSDRRTLERLSACAPDGITTHRGQTMGVVDNTRGGKTAFRPMNFDLANPERGAEIILGDVRSNMGPQFNMYRTILWSPSQVKSMFEAVKRDADRGARVEFVDAYSFWLLLRLEVENVGKDDLTIRL